MTELPPSFPFVTKHKQSWVSKLSSATKTTVSNLPPKVLTLVAEALDPKDFLTVLQVNRAWRRAAQAPTVARAVAAGGHVAAALPVPQDCTPEQNRAPLAWTDVRHAARLVERLYQGPIFLGPRMYIEEAILSPSNRYVLRTLSAIKSRVLHRLGPEGPQGAALLKSESDCLMQFTASNDLTIHAQSPYGPVDLYDLSKHPLRPTPLAPLADYTYRQAIHSADGTTHIFTCSDERLRGYRRNNQGAFTLLSIAELIPKASVFDCSYDGSTAVATTFLGPGDEQLQVFHLKNGQYEQTSRFAPEVCNCAGEDYLTPRGHFFRTFSDCDQGRGIYALDSETARGEIPPMLVTHHESVAFLEDETQVALLGHQVKVYAWPHLNLVKTMDYKTALKEPSLQNYFDGVHRPETPHLRLFSPHPASSDEHAIEAMDRGEAT